MSLNLLDLFSVKGRAAVVTGGSSGIGLMVAKGLVTNGARVYIVALPTDPIDETVSELNLLGSATSNGSAQGYACDLSSKSAIAELASYISNAEGGKLDILISNAGIRRDPPVECNVLTAPLLELQESMFSRTESDWEDTFRVNTTAHYFLGVALLPLLAAAANQEIDGGRSRGAEQGRGVMVITSSCASLHNATNVDLTSYASSKAATDHLVKLLAAKFARWYVRVVGVNPGFVPSRMNLVGAEGNMFAGLFEKVPAKRAGREEDLAGTVLYLVSKAGAYVDGISLCVDGGRVLVANGQE
ncbi:NAD(P)-binding protein [Aspergillus spinulosporus]